MRIALQLQPAAEGKELSSALAAKGALVLTETPGSPYRHTHRTSSTISTQARRNMAVGGTPRTAAALPAIRGNVDLAGSPRVRQVEGGAPYAWVGKQNVARVIVDPALSAKSVGDPTHSEVPRLEIVML